MRRMHRHEGALMSDGADRPKSRPSASQKRRASSQIKVNCTAAQKAQIKAKADAMGQSPAAICLHRLLGEPLPRQRQGRIDQQHLMKFLAANAHFADAIRASVAEMGKPLSNTNQIAHKLNAGRPPERMMNLIEDVLQTHLRVLKLHEELLADCKELRTLGLRTHGYERPGTTGDDG
jgi:hypothetical protein